MFGAVASPSIAGPDRSSFSVSGTVATICRIDFDHTAPSSLDKHDVSFGGYTMLCNSREGFRIVVQHPPGLQNAAIEIDGVTVQLSAGSETLLVESKAPAIQSGTARLLLSDTAPRSIDIAFRIEPKGLVYQ